jgi:hypothetical protein
MYISGPSLHAREHIEKSNEATRLINARVEKGEYPFADFANHVMTIVAD